MHLCAGQHTNIVELKALCQHEAALYLVMAFFPRCPTPRGLRCHAHPTRLSATSHDPL